MTEGRTDLCNTIHITIQNIGTFSLQKGESVLSVLKEQKLLGFSHCGGKGTCGRCAVQFIKGAPLPMPADRRRFSPQQLREGWRLACLAKPVMDAEVVFQPPKEKITILTDDAFRSQAAKTASEACGDTLAVIDLGTTTIVMQLLEAGTGRVIDTCRMLNPQRQYGADVISRMEKALAGEGKALADCVSGLLEQGMEKWLAEGFRPKLAVLAGNTVMIHLLLGLDVSKLAKAPFEPVTTARQIWKISGITTVIMPGISAFVGGDIMAGILACQESMQKEGIATALLVDLGTNGEMALMHRGEILCTATAAGPAFEGGVTTNVPGADLIHIASDLLHSGLIDETGLIQNEKMRDGIASRGVMIRQEDIRNLQMAKAAVLAGIRVLLQEMDLTPNALQRVYLAGGFGYYLDVDAACAIGVLPMMLHDHVKSVGNAALAGSALYAENLYAQGCDVLQPGQHEKECMDEQAERIRLHAKSINLAEMKAFHAYYVDAMYLQPYDC